MAVYVDPPRKYSKRGKRWSHLCSPDPRELNSYAKLHGLRRKHRIPWTHYDVTAEELEFLSGLTRVTSRELVRIMSPYRIRRMKRCGEYRTHCKMVNLCKTHCVRAAMEQDGWDLVDGQFEQRGTASPLPSHVRESK